MIPFDFAYYKPASIEEAITKFQNLQSENKKVMYYGGGTEFISRARRNEVKVDAIIDIKGILECNELKVENKQIIIGAATTLTKITESNIYPLLSDVSRLIATRTERNKITIGGNITGHLFYREALMPFLLANSKVLIAGNSGTKQATIGDVFSSGIQLNEDEFIVQIITDHAFSKYKHFNSKQTKQSKVNYPIVSIASLQVDNEIRVAFSGVCQYPFRLEQIETELNNAANSVEARVQNALKHTPSSIIDDMHASAEYRKFVLQNTLMDVVEKVEGLAN